MIRDPKTADPEVTWELMDRLIATFEAFANEMAEKSPEGLRYVDGLMGFHNAYKRVLLDLEHRTGNALIRSVAVETLRQALFPEGPPLATPPARRCPCVRDWDGMMMNLCDDEIGLYGGRFKSKKKCAMCLGTGVRQDERMGGGADDSPTRR